METKPSYINYFKSTSNYVNHLLRMGNFILALLSILVIANIPRKVL